ncbi:PIP5K1B [Symbiodinium sp. CCMP2592]|nr:PIP5K1B [Symbiodinium sp. CCMP2592]
MGLCASSDTAALVVNSVRQLEQVSEATDSDLPHRLARDGRILADFALFLHEKGRSEELLDLWALDLARAADWNYLHPPENGSSSFTLRRDTRRLVMDDCCKLVNGLEAAWQEYQVSAEGLGNFDDTREWLPHDFPSDTILDEIRHEHDDSCDVTVSKEHSNYNFSIMAMVGIHVSVVCSDLITTWATNAAGGRDECRAAFETRLPMLSYSDCTRDHIRVFPVPPSGSAYSPQTCLEHSFEIEEFAPRLFAEVRCACGISSESYCLSVCRTDFEFIEFGTNSKSGELFFFTYDHQYLLKSTSELEAQTLIRMLPRYLQRLEEEPRSILGRYLGLYRVSMEGHPPRLFFVMRSVTTHTLGISHTYDIKGSTRNRISDPEDNVGKDVNFDEEMGTSLDLPQAIAAEVAAVHQTDVELLQDFRIMDFSLLLQIHDRTDGVFEQRRHECAVRLREIKQKQRFSFRRIPSRRTRALPSLIGSTGMARTEGLSHGPEVHVRMGGPRRTWTWQGTVSQLFRNDAAPSITPAPNNWLPSDGTLVRRDGSMVYTMGLIDMLVPFSAYPKMQYVGMEVITCGNGFASSRVPPDFYCERQIEKVHAMCEQVKPNQLERRD